MKFEGFIGPSYNLPDKSIDAQRLVNMYLEIVESGKGKEEQLAFFKNTAGLEKLFDVGSGPFRLIHLDGLESDDGSYFQLDRIFIVSGPEVYRLYYDRTAGWNKLLLGTLGTSSGPVSAASSDQSYGATVFVDGSSENYVYSKTGTSTETFQTFTAAGYSPVARAHQVVWIDGYFVFIVKNSNTFYVSGWNTLSVSALDFATAEGNPDSIVSVVTNNRNLWMMNKRTIEIYVNTGNADFPFERVQGGFIENGCLAAFSVAKINGVVIWLGRDEKGRGIVNAASGANHQRISTHAIEQAIKGYSDVESATAYAYQDGGHYFYVLNFAEATWCYDLSTKTWHERAYLNGSTLQRHRVECHAFFPYLGIHLVGDYQNGILYKFNDAKNTDNGDEIKRLRSFPHISKESKFLFHKMLHIDMKTGVGLDGDISQLGYDPKIMMRYSDDDCRTWSNTREASLGKLAKNLTRVIWRRLGKSRNRVYEISMTDPVDCIISSANIEVEVGKS